MASVLAPACLWVDGPVDICLSAKDSSTERPVYGGYLDRGLWCCLYTVFLMSVFSFQRGGSRHPSDFPFSVILWPPTSAGQQRPAGSEVAPPSWRLLPPYPTRGLQHLQGAGRACTPVLPPSQPWLRALPCHPRQRCLAMFTACGPHNPVLTPDWTRGPL